MFSPSRGGRSYSVDKDGEFYQWGNLLGSVPIVLSPERVQLPPGMGIPVIVAGDSRNTFILDDNGKLWRKGYYPEESSSFVPYTGFPERIVFLSKNSTEECIAVITDEGEVWVAGKRFQAIPTRIQCPGDLPVIRVTTPWRCAVMEDTDGNLYGWGKNRWGELGLGDKEPREIPTLIQKPEEMGDIVSLQGELGTVILDDKGAVWTCGYNSTGQLGRGGDTTVLMKVEGLPPLVSIDVGDNHSLGIDLEGIVWGWGYSRCSQVYPEIEGYNRPENSKNTGITDASRVFVGDQHSFVETNSGEVFGFGSNRDGQLGIGHKESPVKSLTFIPVSLAPGKKRYVKKPLKSG